MKLFKKLLVFVFFLGIAYPIQAQTNGIRMEVWDNATLVDAQALANNPNLLGAPNSVTILTDRFEAPVNRAGNFVARFTACLTPPVSGTYYWYITANQKAKLWLQTDALNFSNKGISAGSQYNPPPPARMWDYPSLTSPGQRGLQIMNSARTWCVMAIQIEDNNDGLNHMAVGWYRPGTAAEGYVRRYERPLPASYFVPTGYPPVSPPMSITFNADPAVILAEGQQTSLSWNVTNATSCLATSDPSGSLWQGTKPLSGILNVTPLLTTTYHMTCIPSDGSASQTISRTVTNTVYTRLTLIWDEVVQRMDGSAFTNRGGYRVLVSPTSGVQVPSSLYDVGDVTTLTLTSANFPATGVYYFVVICYDTNGMASEYSNEVWAFVWVPGS